MSLSIDDLRSFILVVRERSVSRAASRLGVTQQSVSERVRRLERRLGVQLFSRLPHGMEPKPAAYRLLPYAQSAVTSVDQALRIVDDDDLLRVVVQPSIAPALAVLGGDLAGVRFDVRSEAETELVLSAVSDGSADVGLGTFTSADIPALTAEVADAGGAADGQLPPVGADDCSSVAVGDGGLAADRGEGDDGERSPGKRSMRSVTTPPADLVVEQLFADPVIWVAPPDHPLASRSGAVPASEVAALAVGVTAAANGGTQHLDEDGASHHEDGDTSNAAVRIAARSTVARALAEGRLVEIAVDLPGWVLPVSIAYRSTDRDRPAITSLRAAIVDEHRRSHALEVEPAAPPVTASP